MQLRIRNPRGHFFDHPGRHENILLPADYQGRRRNLRKRLQHIMFDAGIPLPLQPMQGLRLLSHGSKCTTVNQVSVPFDIVPRAFRKNEELDVLHEFLRPKARLDGHHVPENAGSVPVASRPGTHKHEGTHPVGAADGQLLRNDAPHRHTRYAHSLELQGIEQARHVVRHLGARVASAGL